MLGIAVLLLFQLTSGPTLQAAAQSNRETGNAELDIAHTARRLEKPCHYDNFKKATVCKKKDGSSFIGIRSSETPEIEDVNIQPPIAVCRIELINSSGTQDI